MIKNIVFDLGGVLINLDKQACIQNFKKIGFADIEQYIDNYVQNGVFLAFEKGEINEIEFFSLIKKQLAKTASSNEIENAWNSMLLYIPLQKLILLRLLRKKYRVFLLSNTNSIHFEFVRTKYFETNTYNIHDYFEKCYLSYELKCVKPNKDIFQKMIDDAGIIATETLFIDDSDKNIATAQEMGFQTYLAKANEDFSHLFVSL